ncbi:MAG TPA: hypothetical protein VF488_06875 [Gemmatimonadaceae bacterium]
MGGKARVGLSKGIHHALEDLSSVLDKHRGRSVVIGGIAVIARGVPRVTRDIDVAFSGPEVTLRGLSIDLEAAGIVPRIDDAVSFAAESQVLLSRHSGTGVDIDVSLAWLPFEMEAIAAAARPCLVPHGSRLHNRRLSSSTKRLHGALKISRTLSACLRFTVRTWISPAFVDMFESSGRRWTKIASASWTR